MSDDEAQKTKSRFPWKEVFVFLGVRSLANVRRMPFWMDDPERPDPADTLTH
ncbi:MAG: hypothetical protein MUO77_15055 [Anaerolineales bacterium]|nr:hypothetical protein [Anaerolineales bacterium]